MLTGNSLRTEGIQITDKFWQNLRVSVNSLVANDSIQSVWDKQKNNFLEDIMCSQQSEVWVLCRRTSEVLAMRTKRTGLAKPHTVGSVFRESAVAILRTPAVTCMETE
jgi:hypothetical protein